MSLKNKYWWPHPANLRFDKRMKRVMKDLPGGVGYGAVVLTLESLRCEEGFKYPIEDLDLLASEFDISLPILQTVVSNYGFFKIVEDESGKMFVSPLLNELMVPYIEKQKKNQIAGQISAQKRKLKQEQQLYALSQLNSSQHVLRGCEADVEQNRIENKREEKNISLFSDFQQFKKFVLEAYKGKIVCYGPCDYMKTTGIGVSMTGYLQNMHTHKDLSKDDAVAVWKWMFKHQDRLCKLEGSRE